MQKDTADSFGRIHNDLRDIKRTINVMYPEKQCTKSSWLGLSIIYLILLVPGKTCFSQTKSYPSIEKVHLHTDKQTYAAGDTLWFKAYVVVAGQNELSTISKVLHIDLIGEDDKILSSSLLQLSSGLAAGDLLLPDTLKHGYFRLRAYTNWMRNFGAETYFDRVIPVVNDFSKQSQNIVATSLQQKAALGVEFFPEGGPLVQGLRSKICVKVTGYDGHGQYTSGEIVDQNGLLVAKFITSELGVGTFPLLPMPGNTYSAEIKASSGATLRMALPAAQPQGYVLTVNNSGNDTSFVTISTNTPQLVRDVLLVAWGDHDVYYSTKIQLSGQRYRSAIPKRFLPAGVVRITLMSTEEKKTLAERLLFVDDRDPLRLISAVSLKPDLAGGQAVVNIKAVGAGDVPFIGSFSMSAINLDRTFYQEAEESTIRTNLLLTSNINGYVERPNYYFTAGNPVDSLKRFSELDNLLLTHRWGRDLSQFGDVDSSGNTKFLPEEGLLIRGRLLTRANKPIPQSKIYAFALVNGIPVIKDTITDDEGKFTISGTDLYGDVRFTLQAKDVKNKHDVTLLIDSTTSPDVVPFRGIKPNIGQDTADRPHRNNSFQGRKSSAMRSGRGVQLNEVLVTAKKKPYSSNPSGPQSADIILSSDRLKRHSNLRHVIEGADMTIRFNLDNQPILNSRRFPTIKSFITLLDGQLVSNDYLTILDPKEIQSVEIIKNGGKLGYLDQGVFVINTKRNDPSYPYPNEVPGIRTLIFKGYVEPKAFHLVENMQPGDNDPRSVVYWNPDIVPDAKGEVNVSFKHFIKGTYQIAIEGVTIDGRIGRSVLRYVLE